MTISQLILIGESILFALIGCAFLLWRSRRRQKKVLTNVGQLIDQFQVDVVKRREEITRRLTDGYKLSDQEVKTVSGSFLQVERSLLEEIGTTLLNADQFDSGSLLRKIHGCVDVALQYGLEQQRKRPAAVIDDVAVSGMTDDQAFDVWPNAEKSALPGEADEAPVPDVMDESQEISGETAFSVDPLLDLTAPSAIEDLVRKYGIGEEAGSLPSFDEPDMAEDNFDASLWQDSDVEAELAAATEFAEEAGSGEIDDAVSVSAPTTDGEAELDDDLLLQQLMDHVGDSALPATDNTENTDSAWDEELLQKLMQEHDALMASPDLTDSLLNPDEVIGASEDIKEPLPYDSGIEPLLSSQKEIDDEQMIVPETRKAKRKPRSKKVAQEQEQP